MPELSAAQGGMLAPQSEQAQILNSIRVEAFVEIDKERLSQAQARFYGK